MKGYQTALDYTLDFKNTIFNVAAYYKKETGDQPTSSTSFVIDKSITWGLELSVEHYFHPFFKVSLSNSFLDQTININNNEYHGHMILTIL